MRAHEIPLAEHIFGPDRLRLLRRELARPGARDWREHDKGLIRLKREQEHLEQSLKLQLAATVTAELVAENENPERPGRRRGLRT